jgi:hypothetical protein
MGGVAIYAIALRSSAAKSFNFEECKLQSLFCAASPHVVSLNIVMPLDLQCTENCLFFDSQHRPSLGIDINTMQVKAFHVASPVTMHAKHSKHWNRAKFGTYSRHSHSSSIRFRRNCMRRYSALHVKLIKLVSN